MTPNRLLRLLAVFALGVGASQFGFAAWLTAISILIVADTWVDEIIGAIKERNDK